WGGPPPVEYGWARSEATIRRRRRATPSGPTKSCSSHHTAGLSSRARTPSASHSRRRAPATAASGSEVRYATLCGSLASSAARSSSAITSYGGAVTASVGRAYRTARNGRTSATARAYTHAVATIAELVEDRTVEGVYAVARKRRLTTRGGKPYLALELVDPSGRIEGRVWDDVELRDRRFSEGDAVRVLGRVERFDGRLQLAVRSVEAAETDPATLTPAIRRDGDELEGFLEFLAAEIALPPLAALVGSVLSAREIQEGMRLLPAGGGGRHHRHRGRPRH